MEKYVGMSELVEIIFGKKSTIAEQKEAHSSILSNYLNEDFKQNIGEVFYCKKLIINHTYEEFFVDHIRRVLSSHEEYLRYVMSVCLRECDENRNIFDSFIGVCAFVQYMSEQTLRKTGVNYLELDSDIFIVFYRKVLKTAFLKQKGFYRFLEYIRTHKHLEWKHKTNGFTFISGHSKNLHQEINKKSSRYRYFQTLPIETKSSKKVNVRSLAQEVLSNTSVELPILPSEPDLIKRMVAIRKKEIAHEAVEIIRIKAALTNKTSRKKEMSLKAEVNRAKAALIKEISDGNSSSNPDAETNCLAKQQEDIARHENVIQAVIRHNSKNTNRENLNNQIFREAGILEHLKSTIKSLTEVLDECDKK